MGAKTGIEWTDATWSPIRYRVREDAADIARAKGYTSLVQVAEKMAGHVGQHCEHVSDGCLHCYAETNNHRCLPANGTGLPYDRRSRDLVEPFLDMNVLEQPRRWKLPRKVFVENQSDLFGEWVPGSMIQTVWNEMMACSRHTFQVLTKRPRPAFEWLKICNFNPARNVWIGTSVENRATFAERVNWLRQIPAFVRFLSIEPLLEDLGELELRGIDWVITGGESGAGARPMHPDWVRSLRDQCQAAGVAFFFKQWGEWFPLHSADEADNYPKSTQMLEAESMRWMRVRKKAAGRLLDGRQWNEFPEVR